LASASIEPQSLGVGNHILQLQPEKAHEGEAITKLVFRLILREIVERLQHQRLEDHDFIPRLASRRILAFRFALDATIVSAPKQHNSREENETIKEGETPEDWKSKLAKNHQKDKDARWTKKHERSYFGYKNHIGVDRRHTFVRRYVVSDASVPCAMFLAVSWSAKNMTQTRAALRPRKGPGRLYKRLSEYHALRSNAIAPKIGCHRA
jgi:DDE family transposase